MLIDEFRLYAARAGGPRCRKRSCQRHARERSICLPPTPVTLRRADEVGDAITARGGTGRQRILGDPNCRLGDAFYHCHGRDSGGDEPDRPPSGAGGAPGQPQPRCYRHRRRPTRHGELGLAWARALTA